MSKPHADIIGKKINRITCISYMGNGIYQCECECGTEIKMRAVWLLSGKQKECRKCAYKSRVLDRMDYQLDNITVIRYIGKKNKWECLCKCGNLLYMTGYDIHRTPKERKCMSCTKRGIRDAMIGQIFDKWTVLSESQKRGGKRGNVLYFTCKCECGKIQDISSTNLRHKNTTKCRQCAARKSESAFNSIYATYKCNAQKRNLEWHLTQDQFRVLINSNCYYTGLPPSNLHKTDSQEIVYNGIDRLDNSVGYLVDNCVPCNGTVNKMKSNLSYSEFIEICSLIMKMHNGKIVNKESKLKAV